MLWLAHRVCLIRNDSHLALGDKRLLRTRPISAAGTVFYAFGHRMRITRIAKV